jgi:hypothetical protein
MEIKFGACHLAGLDVQRWSLCIAFIEPITAWVSERPEAE